MSAEKLDTVYRTLLEANLDGDYPTARDIADGLGLRPLVVNEALCRLGYSGRVRRLPKAGSRIRWEVVTTQTDASKVYAPPAAAVKAAVVQANLNGRNPTSRDQVDMLSFTYQKVLSALYTLERRGEVGRVHDGRSHNRWKVLKTQ